ncbi:MAG: protochlorophyllide reductase iron-sulfur ATP-binding protein [Methanomassiliicoccales archaeon PtaU1.Bin124]|nr:MAG: protochlorophyllide reductase iron-sulfur ATP-binding protein [Methanomassiliicoccales archaeon PtaU1.Bin124]
MPLAYIVAVAGKGGVGKSTISALLVRALAERAKAVVLAIDADPNINLGEKLGAPAGKTIGELREDLLRHADSLQAGASKHETVRYQMALAKVEGQGFDLLTMGRPEGPGCYCYINNILRTFIDEAVDHYPYVIIDNEAGMEHLSRRTTKRMDTLLLVSDPTSLGVRTAIRILALADEMEIKVGRKVLVMNRAERLPEGVMEMVGTAGFDDVVLLPYDDEVDDLISKGRPLTELTNDDPLFRKVMGLAYSLR